MKQLSLLSATLLLALLAFFSCSKDEEVITGSISGIVTDYTNANAPIAGVSVVLSGNSTQLSRTTGSDGSFSFTELKPGSYTLQVQANGYQTTTKQATVVVGKNTTCDLQLRAEQVTVDVQPMNLIFGRSTSELSFTIRHSSAVAQSFNVANIPDYMEVQPAAGTLKPAATETIVVKVKNRSNIKENLSGQLRVAVGNGSQVVSYTIESAEVESQVSVTPQSLNYAPDVDVLSFSIVNDGAAAEQFSVTNLPDWATASVTSGIVEAKGNVIVTVTIPNRKAITEKRSSQFVVAAGNKQFQMSISVEAYEKVKVSFSPASLTFEKNMSQASFSIISNTGRPLDYTLSSTLNALTLSPASGTLAVQGTQSISVTVQNRQSITTEQTGSITVTIEGNTYTVPVTIKKYEEEPASFSLSPQSLTFDKSTSQKPFSIVSTTARPLNYSITSNLAALALSQTSGMLTANGTQSISVTVQNRQSITTEQTGIISVSIEGITQNIAVTIKKYEEDNNNPDPGTETGTNVTRGLMSYYNFNDGSTSDAQGNYNAVNWGGTFINDTPNGTGKALFLKQKQYLTIGDAPFDGRKYYTVSFWIKDFGASCIVKTKRSGGVTNPTLEVTESIRLRYCTGTSGYSSSFCNFTNDMSGFQVGKWTMITIVTRDNGSGVKNTLYINGQRYDAGTSGNSSATGGTAMEIGGVMIDGSWSSPMKLDNIRFYSVELSDDEVKQIYNYEK